MFGAAQPAPPAGIVLDRDASAGAVDEIERIVGPIRLRWPDGRITWRGDAGCCREVLRRWGEANQLDYCCGLARTAWRAALLAEAPAAVQEQHEATGEPAQQFGGLRYWTLDTGSRERRVVGQAEHLGQGANPRCAVTSLPEEARPAQRRYGARGARDNRVKEEFALLADRLSTHWRWSKQVRLRLSAFASGLVAGLRRLGLPGTALAQAEAPTIRARLRPIEAVVKVSVRRVWVSLHQAHPAQAVFAPAWRALRGCTGSPRCRRGPRAAL